MSKAVSKKRSKVRSKRGGKTAPEVVQMGGREYVRVGPKHLRLRSAERVDPNPGVVERILTKAGNPLTPLDVDKLHDLLSGPDDEFNAELRARREQIKAQHSQFKDDDLRTLHRKLKEIDASLDDLDDSVIRKKEQSLIFLPLLLEFNTSIYNMLAVRGGTAALLSAEATLEAALDQVRSYRALEE